MIDAPHKLYDMVRKYPIKLVLVFAVLGLSIALTSGCGSTPDSTANPGERLFLQHCASCHSIQPGETVLGPSLAGIAATAPTRIEGMGARQYLIASIIDPDAYLIAGFDDLMPTSFGQLLSEAEINALVDYLMSLE